LSKPDQRPHQETPEMETDSTKTVRNETNTTYSCNPKVDVSQDGQALMLTVPIWIQFLLLLICCWTLPSQGTKHAAAVTINKMRQYAAGQTTAQHNNSL
jgi:hypothetical protein